MKRLACMLIAFTLMAGAKAEESNDTTVTVGSKQLVVGDSAGITRVRVFENDSTEMKMTFEGHYANEKEEERFYFTSPFYNTQNRYLPTTPNIFVGLSMLSSSPFSFRNADGMHVNTWKSYEAGIKMLDAGFWLNKRQTWSLSLIYNVLLSQTRFSQNYILSTDADGQAVMVDKGMPVSHNRLFQTSTNTQLMLKWYRVIHDKSGDNGRISFGIGLSADMTSYNNFSCYEADGHTYPEAADFQMHKSRLGLDFQFACEGIILYVRQSLTPLFRSGCGPKVYPLSVGFGIALQ